MTREFGVLRRRLLFEEDENRDEENLRRALVEKGLREGKKKKTVLLGVIVYRISIDVRSYQ
jgi:hypothetical protein